MKRILIIASALVFSISASLMATAQNATTKTQPQKVSTTAAKQEPQKATVKVETKTTATDTKATVPTPAKHKRKSTKPAATGMSATPGSSVKVVETPKPVTTPAKTVEKKK